MVHAVIPQKLITSSGYHGESWLNSLGFCISGKLPAFAGAGALPALRLQGTNRPARPSFNSAAIQA
jgi:hypothetical protein